MFTRRGSFTSPVRHRSGRETHDRSPARCPLPVRPAADRRPARLYVGATSAVLFDAVLVGASTWSAAVRSTDWNLKHRTVGLLFGADLRLVVHPDGDRDGPVRLEAPARVVRVESTPDGLRVDLALKQPLRPRPDGHRSNGSGPNPLPPPDPPSRTLRDLP